MAPEGRRSLPDLSAAVRAAGARFEFVQALRLLEDEAAAAGRKPLGLDEPPREEAAHLAVTHSLAFAPSSVHSVSGESGATPRVTTAFLGLTGPAGALPQHYTEQVAARQADRDRALAAFLDLLHHRALSFYYRASRKYRAPLSHEHAWRWPGARDTFQQILAALVGRGTPSLDGFERLTDRAWLRCSGVMARRARTAAELEAILSDFLDLAVTVRPFVGRWLSIPREVRAALPTRATPPEERQSLAAGAALGRRVWDVQSRVEIEIGPMNRARFLELRRDGELFRRLRSITRALLDDTLEFDIVLLLAPGENLETPMGAHGAAEARLGWTTFTRADPRRPVQRRVVFSGADG